jgi:Fe-S-cluster containining protein
MKGNGKPSRAAITKKADKIKQEKKPEKLTQKQQLCVDCRKCCGYVGVYTDPTIYELSEKEVIHFYEARGATVTRDGEHLFIVFKLPCPHITPKGCAIYNKRPKICKIYSGLEEFGKECLWSSIEKKK